MARAKQSTAKPTANKRKTKRSSSWLGGTIPRAAYWCIVVGLWGLIALTGVFAWFGAQLPSAATWEVPKRAANVRILANDGTLLVNRGVGGTALRLEDMSPWIPQAVIAIEDRRFHSHFGFDLIGFGRAMVRNLARGRISQGGSTLSQQLAKNLFLKPERTIGRKVQELILAFWLEANYSKADILELYLNRVYFGAGANGIDAAARRYFGKSAAAVTAREAAMLAGLLKAPTYYSPARHPKRAKKRAALVLNAMVDEGYIRKEELEGGKTPSITTRFYRSGPEHFVADLVMKSLSSKIGKVNSDITVQTTISPFLMAAANDALTRRLLEKGEQLEISQGAMVTLGRDGAILATIGGRDYAASQFNRAHSAKRQPGSAFKPFVWQAALEKGMTRDTLLVDEPVRIGKWKPTNHDGKYRGEVRLDEALAHSLNTVAVKIVRRTGHGHIRKIARQMGLNSNLSKNASIALGTSEVTLSELTSAYLPYMNGGVRAEPWLIRKITGEKGKVLFRRIAANPIRATSLDTAREMDMMLREVVSRGTGRRARIAGHMTSGKTGTSQDGRDALFVGYTAHMATGIWLGNDDNSPTKTTGGGLPAELFATIMSAAHTGLAPRAIGSDPLVTAQLPHSVPKPKFRKDLGRHRIARSEKDDGTQFDRLQREARSSFIDRLLGRN